LSNETKLQISSQSWTENLSSGAYTELLVGGRGSFEDVKTKKYEGSDERGYSNKKIAIKIY